jgi:hypothetical protein
MGLDLDGKDLNGDRRGPDLRRDGHRLRDRGIAFNAPRGRLLSTLSHGTISRFGRAGPEKEGKRDKKVLDEAVAEW